MLHVVGEEPPLIRSQTQSFSSSGSGLLRVYLYHQPNSPQMAPETSGSLSFTFGEHTAEELCIAAAKACGILPVCHSLFSLATEDLSCWFPPSHVFTVDASSSQVVVYRIRFFFPNWFGPRKSYFWGLTSNQGSPVMDGPTMDYLFAQSRSDFLRRPMVGPLTLDTQETYLGLAVLDMLRIAKERKQSLAEVFRTLSYKSCLPECLRFQLQAQSFLARKRIRRQFGRSLRKFSCLQTGVRFLKLKYLAELEGLEGSVPEETFVTRRPRHGLRDPTWLVHVSAEKGISTSRRGSQLTARSQIPPMSISFFLPNVQDPPCPFCDFPDIADIAIKQASWDDLPEENRVVTEMEFCTLPEALSFVSLVDGYYRLLVDSYHYFCKEVAPPRLLEDLANGCHGPIMAEFATGKLKAREHKGGSHLLRRSPEDFDSYLLTICLETPMGKDFKNLMIQKNKDGTFSMAGVTKKFLSLQEMLGICQRFTLQVDQTAIRLGNFCRPQPQEKSNLIIVRWDRSCLHLPNSPSAQPRRRLNQIVFHKIQAEDLAQCENLGQGTFTRIYRGLKRDPKEDEGLEGDGTSDSHLVEVVMKVLDQSHSRWVEPFLETASLISQLSHKHLVLLHGVSIGAESIMVQEYVRHGALDTYLRRNKATGKVTTIWMLQVAKQLAYALNFLEDKRIAHGNVSARKVLLAREGDLVFGRPPFIKLGDPGVSTTVLTQEVLISRIPWVAPECVWDPKSLAPESDKWSFGATLWEIFNGGNMPISVMDPKAKLQFYQDRQQLPPLHWTELAVLVAQCMDYHPRRRPPFRAILRDLNGFSTSNYELLSEVLSTSGFGGHVETPMGPDPTLFEERHLKYISVLGKGNFGSVELCRYDPLGDSTGELVAVKRLQHSSAEHQHDFEKEISILRSLHHDFVVAYRGVCYSQGEEDAGASSGQRRLHLVMEYLPSGCLRNYLQKNKERLDHKKLLLYAWQVCKGMDYLGSQRYIHRDLAARNILVENENRVKIGDFGLAKILPQGKEYYVVQEPGQSPIFWYAPESLSDCIFSPESDVWSFGVVLYELFTYGSRSHSPTEEFLRLIGPSNPPLVVYHLFKLLKKNKRLPMPAGCPIEVFVLMQSCWSFLPCQRPRFCTLAPQIEVLRDSCCKAQAERRGLL
ncbi:hypothetical protein JD844_034394 [Phrynosoma platyrhinos]|uniref:Tyrosine-protein kinase n=1 Tax=Phrynosoma platyrhinos TaxID=52577 RepID=A0ABQ7T8D1_PHRPL|nr:hypothetical protein JD844_034394 [Phrynosoma platyrhinos]